MDTNVSQQVASDNGHCGSTIGRSRIAWYCHLTPDQLSCVIQTNPHYTSFGSLCELVGCTDMSYSRPSHFVLDHFVGTLKGMIVAPFTAVVKTCTNCTFQHASRFPSPICHRCRGIQCMNCNNPILRKNPSRFCDFCLDFPDDRPMSSQELVDEFESRFGL